MIALCLSMGAYRHPRAKNCANADEALIFEGDAIEYGAVAHSHVVSYQSGGAWKANVSLARPNNTSVLNVRVCTH